MPSIVQKKIGIKKRLINFKQTKKKTEEEINRKIVYLNQDGTIKTVNLKEK